MPTIEYRATNFGQHWGASLSGVGSLSVSWPELVWSAVTVGKPGVAFLLSHGWHSASDIIVRSHTVYANLRQVSGFLERSSLYDDADPSEKRATSYFLGMMTAKILAARLLHVPRLFHLSMLGATGGSALLHGNLEPDSVGEDINGNWIVVEAKGRTGVFSQVAMSAAKSQTRSLRMINGMYPSLRAATQSYFAPELRFAINDPEDFDDDAVDLEFDPMAALRLYYSIVTSLTQGASAVQELSNREFEVRKIDEVGVTIGIDRSIRDRLELNDFLVRKAPSVAMPEVVEATSGVFTVFPDGVTIALDDRWSEGRMNRDSRERRIG